MKKFTAPILLALAVLHSGGCATGQGTLNYFNDSKYVGEWKNGKMHGQGTFTYADGRVQEGIWKNGTFQGDPERQQRTAQERYKRTGSLPPCPGSPARHSYVALPTYKNWTNCVGAITYGEDGKYVGGFRNDKWHGQGTMAYAGGNKYVGEFRNDKKHGQGTFTHRDGRDHGGFLAPRDRRL